MTDLKAEIKPEKDTNKTVVKDYLLSVADENPTKKKEKMDALDEAVFQITNGYLTKKNRKNLLKLLGTKNADTAVDILESLGLFKLFGHNNSRPIDTTDKSSGSTAVDENGKPIKNISIPKYDTASYSKVTPDFEQFGTGISDASVGYFPQAERLFKGFTSTYNAVPTSEPEYVSVSIGDLYLPNVTNPEDFSDGLVDALKNNPTVQKTFSTFVNASLTGSNSLGIRKF